MKFGPIPLSLASGAILAHSVALPQGRLRKGLVLEAEHIAALEAAGNTDVVAAVLEPGDVDENLAAERLARALVPDEAAAGIKRQAAFTGRVNLLADGPGVVSLDSDALLALNSVHPMITLATVPHWQQMQDACMIGTVKIISYAVPEGDLAACQLASGTLRLVPPTLMSASLLVTDITGGAGVKGVEAIENRLTALNVTLDDVTMTSHNEHELSAAISRVKSDLILILTGSATSDAFDIAPQALRQAGGIVTRFGMPVDPGNLLFLGDLKGIPVIGLPGCARSPALNGVDWVLSRVVCGVPPTSEDIAGMGVGGLLKEIPTRPQPRRGKASQS